MKYPITERMEVVKSILSGTINNKRGAEILGVNRRTVKRHKKAFLEKGEVGLADHRHSNNYKLARDQRKKIVETKLENRWQSARSIRDDLKLKVDETTVWRILRANNLTHENIERVKAITGFEAKYPNELWQTDIQGKIDFPNIGILYLIAALDDHSRFCLAGRWFKTQGKMNVLQIWYESLAHRGLPGKMLQDEGSQYKARTRFGLADYGWYAKQIGIELIWAHKAQTKGKIERFWGFVQDDFVPRVIKARSIDEVNGSFRIWLAHYNYTFKSRYFGGVTHWSRYKPSQRRLSRVELHTPLVVEERRKVTRESAISLYGKHYYVPPGYIGCRIWIKVKSNKLYFEANGEIFWKTRLKF